MNSEQRTVVAVLGILAVMISACAGLVWIGYTLFTTGGAPQISLGPTATSTVNPLLSDEGVAITAVLPNSPANLAGLLPGHIIISANGTPVQNSDALRSLVEDASPGSDIVLVLIADGELRQTTAVRSSAPPYLGIEIIDRSDFSPDDIATPTAAPPEATLTVAQVLPGSPAAAADLRVGDMILAVDGVSIRNQTDLIEAIGSKQPGVAVALTFQRGIDTLTRSVTLGSNPDNPTQGYLGIVLGE